MARFIYTNFKPLSQDARMHGGASYRTSYHVGEKSESSVLGGGDLGWLGGGARRRPSHQPDSGALRDSAGRSDQRRVPGSSVDQRGCPLIGGAGRSVQRVEDVRLSLLAEIATTVPAGRDLRFITTGLKITTDLERIGDMAVNFCERALELNQEPQLKPYIDIPRMATISQRMIRESLDAFVREDTDLALKVCKDDQEVDDLNSQIFRETISFMIGDPLTINRAMKISSISKYLERIADHATNIAEMVIFMVKGKSIRHMKELPASI